MIITVYLLISSSEIILPYLFKQKIPLVGRVGLEPTRYHYRRILSPLRLPNSATAPGTLRYFNLISPAYKVFNVSRD